MFLSSVETKAPQDLTEVIFAKIHALANPSAWLIFLKILGLHSVLGFLSLSICHQFGMNPFQTEVSFSDWMMSAGGHNFCMFGCGVLFVGLSLVLSSALLTSEELRGLKRTEFRQILALGMISLGIFSLVGAEMALAIAGLWLVGAFVGGFFATELVLRVRGIQQLGLT